MYIVLQCVCVRGDLEHVSLHFEGIFETLPTKTTPGGRSATHFTCKGGSQKMSYILAWSPPIKVALKGWWYCVCVLFNLRVAAPCNPAMLRKAHWSQHVSGILRHFISKFSPSQASQLWTSQRHQWSKRSQTRTQQWPARQADRIPLPLLPQGNEIARQQRWLTSHKVLRRKSLQTCRALQS